MAEMKELPEFQNIPIVVFTTSDDKKDMDICLGMGARCFITKPPDFADWIKMMKSFSDEWLEGKQA